MNDAVNHRHTGEPRLLDMVKMISVQTGANTAGIETVRADVAEARRDIGAVRRDLVDHVAWEARQKYHPPHPNQQEEPS